MLEQLKLTYFSQHEDVTINFTEGMNAIRGANEAGKSRMFQAVMFGLFGLRAVGLTIDELVTWEHEARELRVDLVFTHAGGRYNLYRTAKSAELVGPGFVSSGLSEVTAKITQIFGADMHIAAKVLVANQNDITKALEEGSSKLIEDLSGINLLDQLILKIQRHKLTGNTKALDLQLVDVEQRLQGSRPVFDHSQLEETLTNAESNYRMLEFSVQELQGELDALKPAYEQGRIDVEYISRFNGAKDRAKAQLAAAQAVLAAYVEPTMPDIEGLESKQAEQAAWLPIKDAYAKFVRIHQAPSEGTFKQYGQALLDKEMAVQKFADESAALKSRIAHGRLHIGGRTACPTCGTAFADAAEIAAREEAAKADIAEAQRSLDAITAERTKSQAKEKAIETLAKGDAQLTAAVQPYLAYIEQVPDCWPSQWAWKAQTQFPDPIDYSGLLKAARAEREKSLEKINAHVRAVQQAEDLAVEVALEPDVVDVDAARETFKQYDLLTERIQGIKLAVANEASKVQAATTALDRATQAAGAAHAAWDADEAQRTSLRTAIAEMVHNNGVIKKLREARPVVANQLWATILSPVSDYFSQIRGVASIVTKDGDDFYINSKKAKVYSGSTMDSLGLAVRMALHRIFLGTVDFLMVDEPARGMDATRETNLLASISRLNIPQTVVVTHSEIIDTYAANVIQL